MIALRPYQIEANNSVREAWQNGIKSQLVVACMGMGKTEIFLSILADELAANQMQRGLIIAHRKELIDQPAQRIEQHWRHALPLPGIVMAEQNDADARLICATIQSLNAVGRLESILANGPISHVVIDEAHHCHIPGTQIETPLGRVPIERIGVGDAVFGWDGAGFAPRGVVKTFAYSYRGPVVRITTTDGNVVTVTPNHKLYSGGQHVYAAQVRPGDTVSVPSLRRTNLQRAGAAAAHSLASSRHETLSAVPRYHAGGGTRHPYRGSSGRTGSVPSLREADGPQVDWRAHLVSPFGQSHVVARGSLPRYADSQRQSCVPAEAFRSYAGAQPDGRSGGPAKDDPHHSEEDSRWGIETLRRATLRQRGASHASGTGGGGPVPIGCDAVRCGGRGRRISVSLQDRHRMARPEDWIGPRRIVALATGTEDGRRPQGATVGVGRVDVAQNDESGCSIREVGVLSVELRHYSGAVYDFEVDTVHNYVANGILSSNSTAASYRSVLDKLKTANPHLRILGVTATPKRTDGDGLRRVFERVAFKATIKEGISKYKALSPFVALGVQLPVDISQIEMRGDDYDPEQLGTVLDADNVLELVFETWHKHAGDRPTMVFTASVAQARHLAQFFQSRDVATAWASGETPKPERAQIIGDFLDGKLQVIVNCALWTEGFDAPRTACVAMVRPTRSDTVYLQAVGRGLRLAEGKTDCLILDFVPLGGRDLIMAGDLLGKPKAQAKREAKAKTEGTVIEAFGITADGVGIDGDPDDVIVKALDLFAQAPVQWTFDGQVSTAGVGNDLTVAIVSPQPRRIEQAQRMRDAGEWRPDWDALLDRLASYQVYAINGNCIPLGTAPTWDDALGLAGEYIDEHGDPTLARRTSSWRHNPPSEKQAAFAYRLGVLRNGMSRGQVAQAITHALALRALRNAKVVK